jgi:hypothetical protein
MTISRFKVLSAVAVASFALLSVSPARAEDENQLKITKKESTITKDKSGERLKGKPFTAAGSKSRLRAILFRRQAPHCKKELMPF